MSTESVQIVLELDPDADPIGGSLSCDHAPPRPFSGWLALARAIEQEVARASASPNSAPTPADQTPQQVSGSHEDARIR